MKTTKKALLHALTCVSSGLARKDLIEQTTSFAFMGDKVVTFNDEISVSCPIDIGITGAVHAEEFYSLLSKIKTKKDDTLELLQEENEIRVAGKRITAGIKLQSKINLPLDEVDEVDDKWNLVPEELMHALKLCMFSASRDMSRPILTCLCCNKTNAAVYASDGYRVTKASVPKLKQSFVIPATIINELTKYNFSHYQVKPSWIHFKGKEGILFSFRTVDGTFPVEACEENLHTEGQEIIFPSTQIEELLNCSEVFAKRESALDQEIKVNVKGKRLTISGQSEYGWAKGRTSIQNTVEQEINFTINPTFLQQILGAATTCIMGKQLILFSSETFKHAIVLCNE